MVRKRTEKILRYHAVFEPVSEGGFTVVVPKLPGLVTEGDTFEEALSMAKDAIEGYLEVLKDAGEDIPAPDTESFTTSIDVEFPRKFA